jgi:hypothetical protein
MSSQVSAGLEVHLREAVSVAALRRLKRAYLKAATGGLGARAPSGAAAERAFVAYLRDGLSGAIA